VQVFAHPDIFFDYIPAVEAIQTIVLSTWGDLEGRFAFQPNFQGEERFYGDFLSGDWMYNTSVQLKEEFGIPGL
jgi:hypothetical protein